MMASAERTPSRSSRHVQSRTASLSLASTTDRISDGAGDEENENFDESPQDTATSNPIADPYYIRSFQSQGHLMPHWRNVLAECRTDASGLVQVLSFVNEQIDREQNLWNLQLHWTGRIESSSLAEELARHPLAADLARHPAAVFNQPARAIFVCDLSETMINDIGSIFHLSPEVFEEHLVQSGYTAKSYLDRDPSTWPTRFLPKRQVSLRWHSLVMRRDMEPRNQSERQDLVRDGLRWWRKVNKIDGRKRLTPLWQSRHLWTLPNIFRQEWSLSAIYHPPRRTLTTDSKRNALVDIGDGDGYDGKVGDDGEVDEVDEIVEVADDDLNVVAWEERVTFCWGNIEQERVPIFFFDPLPHLSLRSGHGKKAATTTFLPFSKRLAPRGAHPQPRVHSDPAALHDVSAYMSAVDDACTDATGWVSHLIRGSSYQNSTAAATDFPILAVFQVVRRDTVVLLSHIGRVLDQISAGSMDERMMQDQLGQWRRLLGRMQSELPVLEKSLGEFFLFPYSDPQAPEPAPAQLTTPLRILRDDIVAMTERCQRAQESLRAEMSLLESKRGIQEAESVARLTELAFLFIPITLAAGLFSMQVKELADDPPPVYAFVIAAGVAVAISYGLRLVQRSSLVSESLRGMEKQIRSDQQVITKNIPARKIVRWVGWKLVTNIKVIVVVSAISTLVLILTQLWTNVAMDGSFKGVITGLTVLLVLMIVYFLLLEGRDELVDWNKVTAPIPANTIFGFGRIWHDPPRVRARERGARSNSRGDDESAREQEPSVDNQV